MKSARQAGDGPVTSGTWWRGQLFLFGERRRPGYSARQGLKLLVIVVVLEGAVRPLLRAGAGWLHVASRTWCGALQMAILAAMAVGLVVGFARVPPPELGLYRWAVWSSTEKHYFAQIVPITLLVFCFTASAGLKVVWTHPHLWRLDCFVFVQQILWGFYQELVYRGILQTELVRRFGATAGILMSNLLFTFGPLHTYHLALARGHAAHLWIFAGIFSIGFYFAILYWRSGNLFIVAVLHGLGDWFIDGLNHISRLAG